MNYKQDCFACHGTQLLFYKKVPHGWIKPVDNEEKLSWKPQFWECRDCGIIICATDGLEVRVPYIPVHYHGWACPKCNI